MADKQQFATTVDTGFDNQPRATIDLNMAGLQPRLEGNRLTVQIPILTGPVFSQQFEFDLKDRYGERGAEMLLDRMSERIIREQLLLELSRR